MGNTRTMSDQIFDRLAALELYFNSKSHHVGRINIKHEEMPSPSLQHGWVLSLAKRRGYLPLYFCNQKITMLFLRVSNSTGDLKDAPRCHECTYLNESTASAKSSINAQYSNIV